ncbi:MAG: carbon-nitrogen hydrolase family protein [Methanobacteriaceae archaeon]|nr:carbon-nitrogen hydrolase family protein [Methanobacteriaceae archaeon]
MKNIKIALCQMNVIDNKKANIEKAIQMIKDAKKQNADLAILPEMFNCPYENEKFIEYSEELNNSITLKTISKVAKEENIYVLAGSIPEKVLNKNDNGKLIERIYNTSCLFNDKGELIGKHRKVHLFDIDVKGKISFKESDTLSSGKNITVIDTTIKFGKIGIGICYDIRFIEQSRIMALEGANILIFPGAFNLTTGPAHWELLFRSRALDNQVFTIGVAPALNKNSNYNSYGHSIIVNPWGEVISQADYDECLIIQDINLDEINKIRDEIPILKNRRTDLYEIKRL